MTRQPSQALRQLWIGGGDGKREPFRGKAVGLRKKYIHADCRRTGRANPVDEPRNQGARPRPLAESVQTRLVDGDYDRRRRAPFPRGQRLVAIEPGKAHCPDRRHVLPQDRHKNQAKQDQTVPNPDYKNKFELD